MTEKKSVNDLAAELGKLMIAEQDAATVRLHEEQRKVEEAKQKATAREAAFSTLFLQAKDCVVEAHKALQASFKTHNFSIRMYDGRDYIAKRVAQLARGGPSRGDNVMYEVFELRNVKKTVEHFVSLHIPVGSHWILAFGREFVNIAEFNNRRNDVFPFETTHGNNIIAYLQKENTNDGYSVFEELDVMQAAQKDDWVKTQFERMLKVVIEAMRKTR